MSLQEYIDSNFDINNNTLKHDTDNSQNEQKHLCTLETKSKSDVISDLQQEIALLKQQLVQDFRNQVFMSKIWFT